MPLIIHRLVVLSLFAAFVAPPTLFADLRLMAEFDGKRYEVISVHPTVVRYPDGEERVLRHGRYVIEGDDVPSLAIGFSPLHYNVDRQDFDYTRHRRGGDLYHYRVSVSCVIHSGEDILVGEEDLSKVWPEADLRDDSAVWALAWWKDSSQTWTGEASVSRKVIGENPSPNQRLSLNISESAVDGRPVILLWKDGAFVPPTRYAGDPANGLFTLLQNGESPPTELLPEWELTDSRGFSWIAYAASWGKPEWVESWKRLNDGRRPDTSKDTNPLNLAAMHGHADVIPTLFDAGYRASLHNSLGMNAGHSAARSGHSAALEALLAGGYRLGSDAKDGFYEPLSLALDYGHDDIFKLLREKGAEIRRFNRSKRDELLASHALRGGVDVVSFLLEKKADPNEEVEGRPILSYAVASGNLATVELLLKSGAKPNAEASPTPLGLACFYNYGDMARLLLENGADPNRGEAASSFPLHYAVLHGNRDLVRLLLEHGANPEAIPTDDRSFGLVELATIAGRKNIVGDLFAAGATCHFKPALADDILILAISNDILEMAMLAFEACVTPGFKFHDEYAPNWVARYYDAKFVSQWLEEAGHGADDPPPNLAEVSAVDAAPKLIEGSLPAYTESMFLRYGNLSERVKLLIDEEGFARFPQFTSGNLPPRLLVDLHSHISHWRFSPATVDGKAVKLVVTFPLNFTYTPPSKEVFELKHLSEPPRPLSQPSPIYPPMLQRGSIDGEVRVSFVIAPDGSVESVDILRSSHPLFTESVFKAVQKWRFQPGTMNGKPVHCRVHINIPFSTN